MYQRLQKQKLFMLFISDCGLTIKTLGMDLEHLPNKQWLKDVMYSLNPGHKIFNESATV